MTKSEFIDKLVSSLTGKVSASTIQENVTYYEQYFASELRSGRTEEEICASLGTPQLIAKGILEAERFQNGNTTDATYTKVDEEKDYRNRGSRRTEGVKRIRIPGPLLLIIAVLIFFAVINIVITLFSALAPIIIPICIVLFIMHIFKNNF
jgi:uncharacterized membrane protein